MDLGTMYAVMRVYDSSDDGLYLCYDNQNDHFYWSEDAPMEELVHITANHFAILARWYWETFRGETPLETWARRYKVSYNRRLQEISYCVDDLVLCGCRVYEGVTEPWLVYEPKYNHVIGDRVIYDWVKTIGNTA